MGLLVLLSLVCVSAATVPAVADTGGQYIYHWKSRVPFQNPFRKVYSCRATQSAPAIYYMWEWSQLCETRYRNLYVIDTAIDLFRPPAPGQFTFARSFTYYCLQAVVEFEGWVLIDWIDPNEPNTLVQNPNNVHIEDFCSL
ncbi:MAG: hypothetical protein AB7G76_09920 [Steroidobacteraceae bacterium]